MSGQHKFSGTSVRRPQDWSCLQPLEQQANTLLVGGRWDGCKTPSGVELVELFSQPFVLQWEGGGQDPLVTVGSAVLSTLVRSLAAKPFQLLRRASFSCCDALGQMEPAEFLNEPWRVVVA